MSPVAAGRLTWITSVEEKIDWTFHDGHEFRSRMLLYVITYLVGKDEGELDFVGGLSIATAACSERLGCPPGQRRGETKRRHSGECNVLCGPVSRVSSGKRRVAQSARVENCSK